MQRAGRSGAPPFGPGHLPTEKVREIRAIAQPLPRLTREAERLRHQLDEAEKRLNAFLSGGAPPTDTADESTQSTDGDRKRQAVGDNGEPRLSSAVAAVAGPAAELQRAAEADAEERARRRLPAEPAVAQRNKRMFGMLLGTLQQHKRELLNEEQEHKKRKELEDAINQEKAAEVAKQRAAAQARLADARDRAAERLASIGVERQEIEKRISEIRHIHEQAVLSHFRKTTVEPAIYWLPRGETPTASVSTAAAAAETEAAEADTQQATAIASSTSAPTSNPNQHERFGEREAPLSPVYGEEDDVAVAPAPQTTPSPAAQSSPVPPPPPANGSPARSPPAPRSPADASR